MPRLKIASPREIDPVGMQLPPHAADHVLRLCEQHLSQDTWDRLVKWHEDYDALPDCGGTVYALAKKDLGPHFNHVTTTLHFRSLDGGDISPLPPDLRDCVVFAAAHGFDAIEFEAFDPIDCHLAEHLKAYPRPYDTNPEVGTYLRHLSERGPEP